MAITLDENFKGTSMTLSADKLTVSQMPGNANFVRVTEGKIGGKWYWEYIWKSGPRVSIGIVSSEIGVNYTNSAGYLCNEPTYSFPADIGSSTGFCNWTYNAPTGGTGGLISWTTDIIYRTSEVPGDGCATYGKGIGVQDTVGIALDLDLHQITYYINGVSQGVALGNLPIKEYYLAIAMHSAFGMESEASINLGRKPFQYSVPEGFKPYDTTEEPPVNPPENEGALLRVTMLDSSEREYQLTKADIEGFINWFNTHTSTMASSYKLTKRVGSRSSEEYLVFNKIISFEVSRF